MQNQALSTQVVTLPDLISQSPFLQSLTSGYPGDDHKIDMTRVPIDSMIFHVTSLEMASVRRAYPDVDFNRIGGMINSSDHELNDLGLTTLSQYTKYTHLLIPLTKVRGYDSFTQKRVHDILQEFFLRNISNITDRIL